jgi:hypothetical protein
MVSLIVVRDLNLLEFLALQRHLWDVRTIESAFHMEDTVDLVVFGFCVDSNLVRKKKLPAEEWEYKLHKKRQH